jgi:hypothetical protein
LIDCLFVCWCVGYTNIKAALFRPVVDKAFPQPTFRIQTQSPRTHIARDMANSIFCICPVRFYRNFSFSLIFLRFFSCLPRYGSALLPFDDANGVLCLLQGEAYALNWPTCIADSVLMGCIPVIVDASPFLPFSDVLDYSMCVSTLSPNFP